MITREDVQKIAHLARLNITEAEEAQFTDQLNSILDYFEQLSELDTRDVPPMTRAVELSNVLRPDQTQVYGDREALLAQAPTPEGDFFRVPQILTTDES
jgi:aspartyl-tRNA(Asn)/glutamyl-tRNA(Gln) amidotransferase subunit C